MSDFIKISDIKITDYQRETLLQTVQEIAQSIEDHGYNPGYPVVLDEDNVLVDGGHRIEAARMSGIIMVPFVYKPDDISNVRYSILCNADRGKGREDDVFDLARLCWKLNKMGMSQRDIGVELGATQTLITRYI